jgi:proteasome accessory factor B
VKPSRRKTSADKSRDDRPKRLLDLVVLLLGARSPVPFREIRDQFKAYRTTEEGSGQRAFERDKAELLELGVPLRYVTPEEDDSIEEAGYVVDLRRYRLPELRLTSDEVAALVLAGSVARAAAGTYAEVVDLALKKLAFDLPAPPDTPGSPARKASPPVIVHFPKQANDLAERLALVEQSIEHRKRLVIEYRTSSTGQATERAIDPYGLAYRQGAWLLVGWCHLRQKVLTFRVDRIGRAEMAPKLKSPDFERPAGFDLRRYANRSPWTFEIEPPVDVELEIAHDQGAIANEDFGDGAVRTSLPDGGTRVAFSSTNPEYIVNRVLAAKGALAVRAPDSLRARVREELERVLGKYSS